MLAVFFLEPPNVYRTIEPAAAAEVQSGVLQDRCDEEPQSQFSQCLFNIGSVSGQQLGKRYVIHEVSAYVPMQ